MKKTILILIVALFSLVGLEANALTMNPFKGAGRVKCSNLLVAGNLVDSRLLAELAQWYSKQPILLVSIEADGSTKLYYLPSASRATVMEADKFQEFLEFINPSRVIILGGDAVVENKFVGLAGEKYKVLVLNSSKWSNNAAALGELLQVNNLQSQFELFRKKIDLLNSPAK